MDWYLTWQDPVALTAAAAGLFLAWRLRRRHGAQSGCAKCPSHTTTAATPEGGGRRVALSDTRLGRRG